MRFECCMITTTHSQYIYSHIRCKEKATGMKTHAACALTYYSAMHTGSQSYIGS